jgi:2-methylisocitrate lyase-like PEP mutase family enzyme
MSMPAHIASLEGLLSPVDDKRSLLLAPGCWDGFSVMLIEQAGFKAAWVGGDTVALGRYGRPGVGMLTAGQMVESVAAIRDRTDLPLLVDAGGGYGNALNVMRAVTNLELAGASAIQLSDHRFPKRLDDLTATPLISAADMIGKLKAALDTRHDALIIARTSVMAAEGTRAALDRAAAYLEVGVDLLMVDGAVTLTKAEDVARMMATSAPFVDRMEDATAHLSNDHEALVARGFGVLLHPKLLLQGLAKAAPAWLGAFRAGTSMDKRDGALMKVAALDQLAGLEALSATARAYS